MEPRSRADFTPHGLAAELAGVVKEKRAAIAAGWLRQARSSDDHPMIAARMARADSEMIAGVQ